MLSAEDAASILGLQVRTVRNYVRDGRLPGVRIGKQYRIARQDLEAFTAGALNHEPTQRADEPARQPSAPHPVGEVSSVVQLEGIDADLSSRIERTLVAARGVSGGGEGEPALRVEHLYDAQRLRLRVVIVGQLADSAELLRVIDALALAPR